MSTIEIFDKADELVSLKHQLGIYEAKLDELVLYVKNYQVISHWSAEEALGMAKEAKGKFNELEEQRKATTEESRAYVNRVNDLYKPYTEKLKDIEGIIKSKISMWNQMVEKKAKEAEKEAEAFAENLGIDVVPYVPKSGGTLRANGATSYEVERSKFSVEDVNLIPREYLMVDEEKVKLALKIGVKSIPGIKIFTEKQIVIKSR